MIYNQNYNGEKNWIIEEDFYDANNLKKTESIMCIGNGVIGSRCANEETSLFTQRDTFINGTFEKASDFEVEELPNIADVFGNNISINGKVVNFESGNIVSYSKQLNLYTGEVTRLVTWENQDGIELNFKFKRFVSLALESLVCQKIEISSKEDIDIEIDSVINAQVTNSGTQIFEEGEKRFYDDFQFMELLQGNECNESIVVINCGHNINKQHAIIPKIERRKMSSIVKSSLKKGDDFVLEKIVTLDVCNDYSRLKEFREVSKLYIKHLSKNGYDNLFEESKNVWQKYWDQFDINIEGDDYSLLGYRFAMYHCRVFTPYNNERCNIGAKGLSGQGYKGHTFWDTEIFLLPMYIFKNPDVAKNLIKYRYLGLEEAKKIAGKDCGARYPWEATKPEFGDATPKYGAVDIITGVQQRIWTGEIELHVTSDVIYGLWLYAQITNDEEFLKEFGHEMIFETANFWVNRGEEHDGIIEIKNVIGPDEYKEHIDNNAFTNYMAKWNCELALKYITDSKLVKYEKYIPQWENFIKKIKLHVPNENGVIPQDDTYLSLKEIDLSKYKKQKNIAEIMNDYTMEQVSEIQVSKQADLMVLFLLKEELFSKEVKVANWNYYEPKTLHDSSLSLSTHVVMASDLGDYDMAYDLFTKDVNIDMSPNMKTSDEGIHAASFGGVWQSIYYGFAGIRFIDGNLRIEPHLPSKWEKLELSIYYKGSKVDLKIDKEKFVVISDDELSFVHAGKKYTVDKYCEVSYE